MPKLIFTISVCSLLCIAAAAQEKDSIKNQNLQPVEIRALRASSNAPFAKTELSAKEIQQQNLGQDLPFLLQYTPSAIVTSDAGAGVGYTSLRIRGTDATRINVTLNGIPVNDAESQGTYFVDLPDLASSSNSIQIQRGVGTSTNGAGAFGGTLSVSTLDQMKETGAEASISAGSFNTQKYTVKAGTGLLKNGFQFDVRMSKIISDGYIQRSASDLKSIQLIAGWQINQKSSLKFMLLTGKEKTGQAWDGVPEDSLKTNRTYNELGQKADGTFYNNQTDNYQQDYYQLFFNHQFSKSLSFNIAGFLTRGKGYYEEFKIGENFANYGLPDFVQGNDTEKTVDLIRQLWLDNYYYGSVFSLLYEKQNTKLSFGGAYDIYDGKHYGDVKWAQYGIPDDYRWYLNDARKNDLNLYLKGQQTFGKLILFGDAQFRNVNYQINGFDDNPALKPSVVYNFFNPKIGISYIIKNENLEKQRAYASFAIANKEPNRDDFEANQNDLPKAEQLKDIEAGYEIEKGKWSASANFYYMSYYNQLILTGKINNVGAYTRTNVPESYRTGIELMAAYKPLYWLNVQANATISQNKIKNFTEYIDNYDDGSQLVNHYRSTDIAFSPNQIFSGIITCTPYSSIKHHQSLNIEMLNKYVSKQFLDNTSNGQRVLNAYYTADFRIRYNLKLQPFKELGVTLGLNNIFNKLYESNGYSYSYISDNALTTANYYYPQAGFNWLLGVTMKW